MGLRPIPGATLPQRVHEGDQTDHLVAGGAALGSAPARDVQRGQVVRLHRAVELPPVDLFDQLVVEAQMMQEHRPRQFHAVIVGGGQLQFGEQVPRPALGHQERTALVRRHGLERAGVDQPHPLGERVDAERRPGQVQEGECRQDGHLDPAVGTQQVDAPLGHQRRSGHGIDDRFGRRVGRRSHEDLDDPGVDLVERRRGLVEMVEGRHAFERFGGRMPHRAQVRPSWRSGQVGGVVPEQVGAGRSEAHHRRRGGGATWSAA